MYFGIFKCPLCRVMASFSGERGLADSFLHDVNMTVIGSYVSRAVLNRHSYPNR